MPSRQANAAEGIESFQLPKALVTRIAKSNVISFIPTMALHIKCLYGFNIASRRNEIPKRYRKRPGRQCDRFHQFFRYGCLLVIVQDGSGKSHYSCNVRTTS